MLLMIGSKQVGLFQAILGIALIVTGGFTTSFSDGTSSFLATIGVSMLAGDIMQMLNPQPKGPEGREAPGSVPNYAFGGPVNITVRGYPVGVLHNRRRIGGAMISAGTYVEGQL